MLSTIFLGIALVISIINSIFQIKIFVKLMMKVTCRYQNMPLKLKMLFFVAIPIEKMNLKNSSYRENRHIRAILFEYFCH